jgi:YHS domain-containing protein
MKHRALFVLFTLLFLVAAVASSAAEKPQTTCAVCGGDIDIAKSPHVDYQGQRIYFCCEHCSAKFVADPEATFAKSAKEGVVFESVQKECPLSGEDVDKKVYADYKGRRVYFCCTKCKAKFEKDPEKYLAKLPGDQRSPDAAPAAPAAK